VPRIVSKGVEIRYEDTGGSGPPIVLVHGFASGLEINWRWTGWFDALAGAGRRVIALDCRGHGQSGKPREPEAYGDGVMRDDVIAVMDAAGLADADLMGYSMGAQIALGLVLRFPERFTTAILGGFGFSNDDKRSAFADALMASDADSLADQSIVAFRQFLERSGQDVAALAALTRGQTMYEDEDAIRRIAIPMLLVSGEKDDALAGATRLGILVPHAGLVTLPEVDHMSAVMNQAYKEAVLSFLAKQSPVAG
jgi:pimeloyl-ACP methyl ester carboxylesterase